MDCTVTPEDRRFREEVRAWLTANVPKEPLPPCGPRQGEFMRRWQRKQYEAGWAGISWPKEYGGRGLSIMQQLIWFEEYARVSAPDVSSLLVALNHGGPTIMLCGSPEQKAYHLPRILKGESIWCQGFSEPGAGSDLASLRTSGRVEGDTLVVNGHKIWSSFADYADYQELVVRTDLAAQKHKGITWAICDMKAPGITVRPIESIDGEHHNCEIFYDNVRIPLANVVGGLNNGWRTAMSTLSFERGTALIEYQLKLAQALEHLIALARNTKTSPDKSLLDDGVTAARLGRLRGQLAGLRSMIYLVLGRTGPDQAPGPEAVYLAVMHSELEKEIMQLAMDILGPLSLERPKVLDRDHWVHRYLWSYQGTIAGGTSEIRRNIIGERILGLPRHQ